MKNHKNVSYCETVEYINVTLSACFPIPEEHWASLERLLVNGNSFSLLGQCIREFKHLDDISERQLITHPKYEFFWELLSLFIKHFKSEHTLFEERLEAMKMFSQQPGEEFLQWLLQDYLGLIIAEHKKQEPPNPVFIQDLDNQTTVEQEPSQIPPDSYDKDSAERAADVIAYCRKHVVQLALIGITQKMSKKNWKNETQFKQPGIQMYPFLYDKSIPMEVEEIDLLQQLGENVENYVSDLHGTQKSFCPASYLTEVHDQASRQLAIIRQKWEERSHNTRNFSSRRRNENRKGIKIIADTWLAPLNNSLVAEVCKVDIRYADQLLSRYKKDFLSEIYHTVNNYREDKDV